MCVAWCDMTALWEKCNDMNHRSRCSDWSSVFCFFVLISCANPLAITNIRYKPYWTALWKKSCRSIFCSLQFNFRSSDSEVLQKWGDWWKTRQPEYINFSSVFRMKSRPEAREDGWKCLACLHTNVFGRVMLEKKRKLFIGLVPSVFLWNVIITQAGHIYCIYRQRAGVAGAFYLSIFSQLNIWRKH